MALIVEDGTGITDANSYSSVAEAQAYFDLKGIVTTITEESLINGTQYLDLSFSRTYGGRKVASDQSLQFPRTAFTDKEGFRREASTIHKELKTALYESAKLEIDGTNLFDNTNNGTDNLKSISNAVDGAVSQSKEWFSPTNTNKKTNIGKYLSVILANSSPFVVRVK